MNENKKEFVGVGERIAQKIEELGITQKDVYDVTGFSKTTMSNYVKGRRLPNTGELYQLAKFFKVSMEWLLTGELVTTNENRISIQESAGLLSTDISPSDIELLAKFHQLPEKQQGIIEGRIEEMLSDRKAGSSSKESSPSKNTGRQDAAARQGIA